MWSVVNSIYYTPITLCFLTSQINIVYFRSAPQFPETLTQNISIAVLAKAFRIFVLFVWQIYVLFYEFAGRNNNQLLNKMKGAKREKQIPIGELIKPSV